jgi:tRNA-modifying protein YgfZ
VAALVLDPQGHVEHAMYGVDDGEAFTAHVEPGEATALVEWLDSMRFMMRVEVADVTDDLAVTWRPAKALTSVEDGPTLVEENSSLVEVRAARRASKPAHVPADLPPTDSLHAYEFVPRRELTKYARAAGPACGMWAFEALRIARGEPRLGLDTDHRTIPNEAGWIGTAVHLDKGCYRGQETVARVHTLGKPPRRLTMLHLDGSENRLPVRGSDLLLGDKHVGFAGTSARHHQLGPIALAIVKRNVPLDAQLVVDGLDAGQEVIVDPEVGLHMRPTLR